MLLHLDVSDDAAVRSGNRNFLWSSSGGANVRSLGSDTGRALALMRESALSSLGFNNDAEVGNGEMLFCPNIGALGNEKSFLK